MMLLEFMAVFTCTLFAGAAIYINVVEHPARLECGTELAATVFAPSYNRAAVMQATLALVSTLSAVGVWALGGGLLWLVGALLIFVVVPFTLVVIMPTNIKLKSADLDKSADSTRVLLESWGRLHLFRSISSAMAAAIFIALTIAS